MSSENLEVGKFEAAGFPAVLHELVRKLASGRLDVTSAVGTRHLWLEAGHVRAVVSELEDEKLGRWLSKRGLIEPHRMAISLLRQPEGVRYGTFLVQEGLLVADLLVRELGALSVEIVSRLLFDPADFCFDLGDNLPGDAASLEMTTASLLAAAARAVTDASRLEDLVGPFRYLWAAQDALLRYQQVQLSPQEGFLLSRVDGTGTALQLRRVVGLPPAEVTRGLGVLVAAGLVETRKEPATHAVARGVVATAPATTAEPPATENLQYTPQQAREYADVIRLAAEFHHRNFYNRLGLSPGATQDQIHSRYLELARVYHPDRAGEPHLRSLRHELAAISSALHEAHQVLSGAETRTRYDRGSKPVVVAGPDSISDADRRAQARAELVSANVARAKELIRVGDRGMAVQLLDQAVRLDPQAEPLLLLARLELQNPMWTQRALDHLKHALALAPRFTEAWLELASFWGVRGLRERQRQCLDQVLTYDPNNADVKAVLAGIKSNIKKTK
jgi:tetratricopeptide (TPR) repeat protein